VPLRPGDVLLLDNLRTAHGREPYTGVREVAVALADPVTPVAESGWLPPVAESRRLPPVAEVASTGDQRVTQLQP